MTSFDFSTSVLYSFTLLVYTYFYKSTFIAGEPILLGSDDSNDLEFFINHDKIQANNSCKNTMSNISTLPRFNSSQTESERTDFGLPVSELVKFFERKAKSTYERMLISARGQEILSKDLKYHIPFDKDNIDWLSLMDEVNEGSIPYFNLHERNIMLE